MLEVLFFVSFNKTKKNLNAFMSTSSQNSISLFIETKFLALAQSKYAYFRKSLQICRQDNYELLYALRVSLTS